MTDQPKDIGSELRQAEALEAGLTRAFASLQPPSGAIERLLAKLAELEFNESQLTLDQNDPYNFEQALLAQQQDAEYEGSDLLAAGLEEEPIDESEFDDEED